MRIVGGRWAGRDLTSPGRRVRPTPEEVRSAWLDRVEAELNGATVVDLFAGSGALGLEALSRGARHCDFVENGPAALHALKANVRALRVGSPARGARPPTARIFKRDAIPFADALDADAYDVAFADPPYGSAKLDRVVAAWLARPFARLLGVEHDPAHALPGRGERISFGRQAVTLFRRPQARRTRGRRRGDADAPSGRRG